MRVRLLIVLAAASSIGGALAVQGCGSSTEASGGGEVADEGGVREAGESDAMRDPACDPDADLFAKVHDASIGDGASTTGLCLACARSQCESAISKCTIDCPCQGIVGRSLECYVTTQQLGCAYDLTDYLVSPETRKYALGLLGCVQGACPVECVIDGGDAPDAPDAPDASDASAAD